METLRGSEVSVCGGRASSGRFCVPELPRNDFNPSGLGPKSLPQGLRRLLGDKKACDAMIWPCSELRSLTLHLEPPAPDGGRCVRLPGPSSLLLPATASTKGTSNFSHYEVSF